VPGFLSSRPNWLPRPLPRKRVLSPLTLVPGGGGGAHLLVGEGAGEADSDTLPNLGIQ
jgi:hypothetical protein